jgi:hypothetical protein
MCQREMGSGDGMMEEEALEVFAVPSNRDSTVRQSARHGLDERHISTSAQECICTFVEETLRLSYRSFYIFIADITNIPEPLYKQNHYKHATSDRDPTASTCLMPGYSRFTTSSARPKTVQKVKICVRHCTK